ncbi:MAG: tetratricopeptide repeat protein [Chloroflexi bacterium]|nr:tetratricopeptide repeat protein [Chloroflexota bacterium]MCY4247820.1 tetratricopeptide repeat protein [Chloroflexota bacterium]
MYDNYPQCHVPQNNIVQRFFAQPAGAIVLEMVMTVVITVAAGSAFDLFDPFDGASVAQPAQVAVAHSPLLPLWDASLAYLSQRHFVAAEAIADVAAASDPNEPLNFALLGTINLHSRDYAEAQSDFTTLLSLAPDSFDGHNSLCWAQGELGEFASAWQHCEAALQMAQSPLQRASALENRCWLQVEMAAYAAAASDCLAVLELLAGCHNEICALAHYNLGRIALARSEPDAALQHFNLAAHIGSAYAQMYLDIAHLYAAMGYEVAAERSFSRYQQLNASALAAK